MRCHPDRVAEADKVAAQERFQRLQRAYRDHDLEGLRGLLRELDEDPDAAAGESGPEAAAALTRCLSALRVATACTMKSGPAAQLASLPQDGRFVVEHPSGVTEILIETDANGTMTGAGTLRSARKLFEGLVFPRA